MMVLQEFFIATVPHPEWNRAHAVWGKASHAWPVCWLHRYRCMLAAPKHTLVPACRWTTSQLLTWCPSSHHSHGAHVVHMHMAAVEATGCPHRDVQECPVSAVIAGGNCYHLHNYCLTAGRTTHSRRSSQDGSITLCHSPYRWKLDAAQLQAARLAHTSTCLRRGHASQQ